MIKIQDLSRRYGALTAVDGLSVTIRDGLIYGLLGVNGAGKSTTLGMITGCLAPSGGSVCVNGHDLFTEPEAAKRAIGYLPEIPPLYPEMRVGEYLRFVARARGIARAARSAAIGDAMQKTGIRDVQNCLCGQLSKGYRQRVGLAQAILGEPEIIILDEPTVGLDPAQVVEMRQLIRSLGARHTVLFSSHILSEVSLVCDRVLILDHGKLIGEDTPENLVRRLDRGEVLEITLLDAQGQAQALLARIPGVDRVEAAEDPTGGARLLRVHVTPGAEIREAVGVALARAGVAVLNMQTQQHSLEDAFLRLTQTEKTAKGEEDKA